MLLANPNNCTAGAKTQLRRTVSKATKNI